jgi:hypothetical protein
MRSRVLTPPAHGYAAESDRAFGHRTSAIASLSLGAHKDGALKFARAIRARR